MFNKIFASLVFLSASLIAFAQPANDDPCNATPLTVNSTCTFSNQATTSATASVGVPAPGCANYNGDDVWFSVTVPANGNLNFDSNTGNITDGGMAIYRGTCNSLTLIECDDDDSANGLMPAINATGLIPGETIWIRFWRYGGNANASANYSFQLCVYSAIPPPALTNDDPCNALPIAVNSSCNFTTYSNAGASASVGVPAPGCASYSGGDVWFSATVPASGSLIFDSNTGVITDGGMAIYRGSCNALTLIECDDDDSANGLMPSINASGLIPGETIWIRFWEFGNNNNGTFDLCVYDINFVPNCTSPICTSPTPDDCNSACSLGILSTPPACPATDVVVDNFCLSNVGATAENPYTYLTNCQGVIGNDMASPAIDVWYSFTATSTSATFSVTGLNSPNIALYQGTNCTNSFGLGCNTGSAGSVSLTYGSLFIGQSYLIRVSGGDTLDVGDFNLGITSFNNCDDCLLSSSLVVNPPPANGVYAGGQTVEFCYTVESWTTTAVNWFHGVSPSFGAGWDLSTLTPTSIPPSCDGYGDWDWYLSVTGLNTGQTFGPGFYYDSSLGDPNVNYPDSDPGDNFGDDCTGPWTFCFEITTNACPPNTSGASLNVSIDTYGDSESGSWSSLGCTLDPVYEFFSTATCCPLPTVSSSSPVCAGGNNGSIFVSTSATAPFTYTYENSLGNVIQVNSQSQALDTLSGLSAGWYYITVADAQGCVALDSIEVVDPPTLTGTFDTSICSNSFFLFNGTTYNASNLSGTEILTSVDGCDSSVTVNVTLLSIDSTFETLSSCNPADTGVVVSQFTNVFGCDSIHTVSTSLSPFSSATVDITDCDSTQVLGTWFFASTSFNDTIVAGAANGCDSITTFNLTINSSDQTLAAATSCNPADTGVVVAQFTNVLGCDSFHTVTTTLLPTAFETVNITDCDSTQVLGTWYFTSTSFNDTIIAGAANGCDSITTFNLTINSSDQTFTAATSCNPADTGVVVSQFTNLLGCDSIHTVTTTLLPPAFETVNITDCDSTQVLGTWYFASTSFNDTIVAGAANGCDSITTFNITINNSDQTFAAATSCNPADTGVVVSQFTNALGCDSIHTVTTTLLPTAFETVNITDCDSTQVLGTWYFASTSFNDTIVAGAANGCDSITTFNLTINSSDQTFATATSCNPADTGVVVTQFTNVVGCDSIHTVTTTLLPTSFETVNTTDCDSTQVLGTWYFASTSFNDTIVGGAANGCDSITTFNITINSSNQTFAAATSCNPADTGVSVSQFTNIFGCDSIHTVSTTLLPTAFETVNITDCDSTQVLGTWYFASTSFNDTIVAGATNSCDSITTFNITINSSDQTFATATSCNPADTGIAVLQFTNSSGCDSIHTVATSLFPVNLTIVNITNCDSTEVLGTWYFASTSFNDTIVAGAANGCDSVTTYNLTINSSDQTFAATTSCNPADTGVVVSQFTNALGCDSIHTVTTTLLPTAFETVNITDCDSTQVLGTWYFASTSFNDTIVAGAGNGCDSITTFNLTINNSDQTFAATTSCNPTDTGVVVSQFTNVAGCDSIHTVTTTLIPTAFETVNVTDCDSTQVLGTWYFASTSINDTIVAGATNGCDSIITFNITINSSNQTFAAATSCNPADTGVVVSQFTNALGCDSIHTVTTTLLPTAFETVNITDCDSTQVLGTWYFASTSFNDTIVAGAANGCDSITTFNITINNSDQTFAAATSCNPADTGVVVSQFTNALGCDSIHTVTTTLLPTAFETVNITDCDSTQVLGTWYFASTSFNDTIIAGAANGCDSITTFNLTINNSDQTFATTTSCNPADTGVVVSQFTNLLGCDSIHIVTTTLLPTAFETVDITDCDSTQVLGTWYFASISFNDTIVGGAANGCDSITTFNITINNSDQTFATATSCNPADTGVVVSQLTNALGCDSIHTVTTTLLPTAFETVNVTDCDSTQVLGTWYFASTSFNDTIVAGAANGCDSITTFNITINNSDQTFAATTSCNPADTGVVVSQFTNVLGCDSIHTVTTTLLPTAFETVDITDCDSTQVLGSWYFASTSFNDTIVGGAANGCDSITTFNITINNSDQTFAAATSCNPADTGVVVSQLTNALGCDSIHTVTTTLLPTAFETVDITDCDSTQVLGTWYFASISFNDTILAGAANGCDSITTFNITINNSDQTFGAATSCNPADTGIVVSQFTNVFGCDSIHTITTQLIFSTSSFNTFTSCDEFTWIDGTTYYNDTILVDTLVGSNTCDSIATTEIRILNSSSATIPVLICPNDLPFALTDDIIIDGNQNIILDTLNNSLNCDSVITYDISYAPSYEVNPNYIIANLGDSVSFVINGMNADVLFAYSSNNGSECPSPCNDYILIPTQEFNNYYFSIIDTSTNCNFSDTLIIESRLFSELNVPNIFTPNNDGRNDIFRCYGENIDQYSLEIFDRFGGRMFKSNELISGWDGYFLGQPVESGVYTAIIEATGLDGQKYSIAQIIKLVR